MDENHVSNNLNPGEAVVDVDIREAGVDSNPQCFIDTVETTLGAALVEKSPKVQLGDTIVDEPKNAEDGSRSQSLIDVANNTFKELCKTLENEQTKLMELEERRQKLQEEMQRLKHEIEEEKHAYRLNLIDSISENAEYHSSSATSLCKNSNTEEVEPDYDPLEYDVIIEEHRLETCYEEDELNAEDEEEDDIGGVTQRYQPQNDQDEPKQSQCMEAEFENEQCSKDGETLKAMDTAE